MQIQIMLLKVKSNQRMMNKMMMIMITTNDKTDD